MSSRSIPAWAGKPMGRSDRLTVTWVHPRVGGETPKRLVSRDSVSGPSPRGRGNRVKKALEEGRQGSIPAWAGKPTIVRVVGSLEGVHPRVGGETRSGDHPMRLTRVHPRVGGETVGRRRLSPGRYGPSPRGRGNRDEFLHRGLEVGSIPAWAGKPGTKSSAVTLPTVHPRVGGETSRRTGTATISSGPSPRGRGKPSGLSCLVSSRKVHPRVGGETTGYWVADRVG